MKHTTHTIERSENFHEDVLFTVIFPTFNESENVIPLMKELMTHLRSSPYTYEILFVDDSNDRTPTLIRDCIKRYDHVALIHRAPKDRKGLSSAFATGFQYARGEYIICMDSDLQHPPEAVPRIMEQAIQTQTDVVVGSRYREGGHADGLLTAYRKFISHFCRFFSWVFLPATRKSSDPGAGIFALHHSIARKIDMQNLRGFKILIEVLAQNKNASVSEIAYGFRKRENNDSKATIKQGLQYLMQVFDLWRAYYVKPFYAQFLRHKMHLFFTIVLGIFFISGIIFFSGLVEGPLAKFVFTISIVLAFQGMFSIFLHLYTWNNPLENFGLERYLPYEDPQISFTAMIPAREEEEVLITTIKQIATIDYPDHLKETLVLIYKDDDPQTIAAAQKAIAEINKPNVRLVDFGGDPGPSKSRGLNLGLQESQMDVVTIFDAEDRVQKDLYKAINTIFVRKNVDVVQSGVQLMNYHSNWYSLFNVLEYYFWFKSSLHFFAKKGVVPLGGNTVFMKRKMVEQVGGWDCNCLTEDADIGIRLATQGAKFDIFYDESLATREQTPPTLASFVKQRTRWNQGFIQILFKGEWLKLESFLQKVLILYVLGWPFMQALLVFFLPFSIVAAFFIKIPIVYSLIAFIPLYALLAIAVISALAIYDFTRHYRTKYSPLLLITIFFMIIPFQMLLGISAFRAIIRNISGNLNWEKTEHLNIEYSVTSEGKSS